MMRPCSARRLVTGATLILLLIISLLINTGLARAADGAVYVTLDGRALRLDQPGQVQDGRTLVPFRPIFEALGAKVSWDARSQSVSATRGQDSLLLTVGSRVVEWRGSLIKVDTPPVIVEGRTLVPLRLVAQALGLHVRWEASTRTVHLERNPADKQLAKGIRLVHEKGCMVCHAINGAGGQVAPKLNGVADRYGSEWLRTWLENPQAVRSGSRMPNFRFTEQEIDAVITYLESLQ